MVLLFLFVTGLVFGSFLAAFTWRLTHGVSIAQGRSFCDTCKKPISWFDNIPLFSFLFLGGKCRHCKSKISARYPIIESVTALSFLGIYFSFDVLLKNFYWLTPFNFLGIVFFFFLAFISIGIIVTDLEDMVIPDTFVFLLFLISFFCLLFSPDQSFWVRLFVGFSSASFFLILNLVTRGKGMGLGDVKLALPLGFLLSYPQVVVWIFLSFIIGSVVGVTMLVSGRATKKTRIPFGPFMILSFWVTLLLGPYLVQYLIPLF